MVQVSDYLPLDRGSAWFDLGLTWATKQCHEVLNEIGSNIGSSDTVHITSKSIKLS